jgi:hypothetical protein
VSEVEAENSRYQQPPDIGDLVSFSHINHSMLNCLCKIIDFSLDSQMGPISFHSFIEGKWALLLTFNKCFDPVATTVNGRTLPLTKFKLFLRKLECSVSY